MAAGVHCVSARPDAVVGYRLRSYSLAAVVFRGDGAIVAAAIVVQVVLKSQLEPAAHIEASRHPAQSDFAAAPVILAVGFAAAVVVVAVVRSSRR